MDYFFIFCHQISGGKFSQIKMNHAHMQAEIGSKKSCSNTFFTCIKTWFPGRVKIPHISCNLGINKCIDHGITLFMPQSFDDTGLFVLFGVSRSIRHLSADGSNIQRSDCRLDQ